MTDWYKKIPQIQGYYACITDDVVLAAKISALLSTENMYMPILDAPRISRPDASNEVIRRVNLLGYLHPRKIILGNLTDKEKIALVGHLPLRRLINLSSDQDYQSFAKWIEQLTTFKGTLVCRKEQIALGLLLAQYQKKKLEVNENAPDLKESDIESYAGKDHLVVLDDQSGIVPVLTANYAFSLNAKLKLLPSKPNQEIESVYEDIMDSGTIKNRSRGKRATRNLMSHHLKLQAKFDTNNVDAKFITFVTSGFPYGYFYQELPTTHLISNPDLGLNIIKGLMSSQMPTNVALTIDPGFFSKSETTSVNKSLLKLGTTVKCLRGRDASVYPVGVHLNVYPYDLLFICSHAGQTDGQEFTLELVDKSEKKHSLVIEVADAFAFTGKGSGKDAMIEVKSHISFIGFDGKDWNDPTKKTPPGLIEDFITNKDRRNWKILKQRKISKVSRAVVLKMFDGYYIPMEHAVAGHELPFIFNNACITFQEFSGRFIFAGARAYVGTLTEVDSDYAKKIAEEFFSQMDVDKPIPLHLWEIQKNLAKTPEEYTYMHVGVFNTYLKPADQKIDNLSDRLNHYIGLYQTKNEEKPEYSEKVDAYIDFLKVEKKKLNL